MKYKNISDKSRTSLNKEINRLKKRILALNDIEREKKEIECLLRERSKELNCLYGLSELIERYDPSIDKILKGLTHLIPVSWQYPEITRVRILFYESEFRSKNFRESQWRQDTDIKVAGQIIGKIEVYYIKKMAENYEGPFLKEERILIDHLSYRISRLTERIHAKKQLHVEQLTLKNMNITLREVLSKVQIEKKEIGYSIHTNCEKIILPIIHALEADANFKQKKYISLLKSNLNDIISPFINQLSRDFMRLTPSEIQICNMIKNGLSTKEIANLRGLSDSTIHRHRENIRKKLNLINKDINLITYLNTYMETAP
ncbi:MAG: helix-turn-helix transcriptional regulator [Nitrospiraceae bacterium]|nr:MAG: helix-turn-helix transcriptional regulator [Nitrospiraceae bacterium]